MGEFCLSYEYNPKLYSLIKDRVKGQKATGTCQLENSILYHIHKNDDTITKLQFRHYIIKRQTDGQHIQHCTLVYMQNDILYMESKANGIHKKIKFGRWCKANKIINSKEFEPYGIQFF